MRICNLWRVSQALLALSLALSVSAETKMIVNMANGARGSVTLYAGQSLKCDAEAGTLSFVPPYDKGNEPIKLSTIESIKFTGNWTGVEESVADKQLSLRSNPVRDCLDFNGGVEAGSEGRIHDLSGREVLRFVWRDAPVNVSGLSAGVYILNIMNTSIKIVKL